MGRRVFRTLALAAPFSALLAALCAPACGGGEPSAELKAEFAKANQAYARRAHEEARSAYRSILERDPDFSAARLMLGKVFYYERKFPEAQAEFARVFDEEPENLDARLWLAKAMVNRPEGVKDGVAHLDAILKVDSTHTEAWLMKAMTLERAQKSDQAIAAYRLVINEGRRVALAHLRLGVIFRRAGENQKAGEHFRMARLLAGNNAALTRRILEAASGTSGAAK